MTENVSGGRVLMILQAKPGINREQIGPVMSDEIRATVRLYLDGKIEQWFSRRDGRGVVFILSCEGAEQAREWMDALPLAEAGLVEHEYIELGPLMPLGLLVGGDPWGTTTSPS